MMIPSRIKTGRPVSERVSRERKTSKNEGLESSFFFLTTTGTRKAIRSPAFSDALIAVAFSSGTSSEDHAGAAFVGGAKMLVKSPVLR